MIVGINMQQPIREATSPHGVSGEMNLMTHRMHHMEETGGVDGAKAANNDSTLYDSQIPGHEHVIGVGMPPQQVYVNPNGHGGLVGHAGINSLQSQFQALGFAHQQHEEASSTEPSSSQSNTNNSDEDQDGDEEEGEPVKLFVGQVPKNLEEEEIFPVFNAFGPLKDVAIIRDKHSGLHRGCAFVTYWNMADAQTAQESLHDAYTFPGGRRPAQVKPAEPSGTFTTPVIQESKLFIGMLSRKAGEDEVKSLFEPFGEIKEIHLIRNADGTSKGAAFLRFVSRDSAFSAIDSLNSQYTMEGSARPLIVRFADSKQQRQQRQMGTGGRGHPMMAMPHGAYSPYHAQMVAPMGLHHPGPAPQNVYQMAPQHYAAAGSYPPTAQAYMYPPHHQYGQMAPYGYPSHHQQQRVDMRPQGARPREGPPGANLFVYHLPHDLTDADLATAFNPFGNVVSAKVYVDKYTGESKGFGK
ncbi:hypothetical protein MPSEU_000294000 [Mayamaea pseudoterrestris]|nr:hypothetical protein MPSEU_000294000 [Mayamaea pseudoterrestris]